jgi:hypothetical protein
LAEISEWHVVLKGPLLQLMLRMAEESGESLSYILAQAMHTEATRRGYEPGSKSREEWKYHQILDKLDNTREAHAKKYHW